MIACVAAATMFTACNSGAKENKTEEPQATETPAAEAPATEGNVIDDYAKLVDEMLEVGAKVKAGDAAAVQRMMELSQQAQGMMGKLQEELPNMTEEQKAKFEEIQKKAMEMAQQ